MLGKILEWLFYSDLFQKHRGKFYRDAYQQGVFDQQVAEMYKEDYLPTINLPMEMRFDKCKTIDTKPFEAEIEGETNGMV